MVDKISIMNKRLTATEARTMIRACLENGKVSFRKHAIDRLFERKIPMAQVEHVLRAGAVSGPELVGDEWRHTATAGRISVVVAVYEAIVVVTIMRTGR
jgi:hypothetical protein